MTTEVSSNYQNKLYFIFLFIEYETNVNASIKKNELRKSQLSNAIIHYYKINNNQYKK